MRTPSAPLRICFLACVLIAFPACGTFGEGGAGPSEDAGSEDGGDAVDTAGDWVEPDAMDAGDTDALAADVGDATDGAQPDGDAQDLGSDGSDGDGEVTGDVGPEDGDPTGDGGDGVDDAGPPSDTAADGGDTVDMGPEDVAQAGPVPAPGDLLITEIMADPSGISDSLGEWLEIRNVSGAAVDLSHCVLHDGDDDSFGLSVVSVPLTMEPGAYWVLGTNGDEATNGGVEVHVVYENFYLSNKGDEVRLTCAGALVDEVIYEADTWPLGTGASLSFDPQAEQTVAANDDLASWCAAPDLYTVGNKGSPGKANPGCPVPDTEIDSCVLISPLSAASLVGDPITVVGMVFDAGDTDKNPWVDAVTGLVAEAGWAPVSTDPVLNPGDWTWAAASAAVNWEEPADMPGYDQYEMVMNAPGPGEFDIAFRFSLDGGDTWTLCDTTGSDDGYATGDAGHLLSVTDPCLDDPCTELPAPTCEDGILIESVGPGTCTLDGITAVCTFDTKSVECALIGGACANGLCEGGAVAPAPGEVIITEIMQNPKAVSDVDGEWFEVQNVSDAFVNLDSCVLASANDGDSVVSTGGALLLLPDQIAVFTRSSDITVNGGVEGSFMWDSIVLGNSDDSLSLSCGAVLIDEVAWDGGSTFPDPNGASMQLDPSAFDSATNDFGSNWCEGYQTYGSSDLGTPGMENPPCDPCDALICNEPPAPACQGDSVLAFESDGFCFDGACNYPQIASESCSTQGLECVDGACVEPVPACDVYCDLAATNCIDETGIDFEDLTCEEACASWPEGIEGDTADDTVWCRITHLQLAANDPVTHCPHGAPEGGGVCFDQCAGTECNEAPEPDCAGDVAMTWAGPGACGQGVCEYPSASEDCAATGDICDAGACVDIPTACETYCALAATNCTDQDALDFGLDTTCLDLCNTWPEGLPTDVGIHTVSCRVYHLGLAADDPALHCPHGAPDGGGVCVTSPEPLVINEIDYDQNGTETAEFLEILHTGSQPASLVHYLVEAYNGATAEVYDVFKLVEAGDQLPPSQYLVIGSSSLGDALSIEVPDGFLQNGGTSGDALRVIMTDGTVIDSMSYDGYVLGWTEGQFGADDDPGNGSLCRCPDGVDTGFNDADFFVTQNMTPGAANDCEGVGGQP